MGLSWQGQKVGGWTDSFGVEKGAMQCALMSPTAAAHYLKPWSYNGSSTQSEEARSCALLLPAHSTQIWKLDSRAQTGTDSGLVARCLDI